MIMGCRLWKCCGEGSVGDAVVLAGFDDGLFGALLPMPCTFYDHPGVDWVPRRVVTSKDQAR